MAWGSDTAATQLTGITTEQFFNQVPTLKMRTRYGPGVSIPTDNGAEIEALAGSNPSFAAWEQNETYTIALLLKGRSGGASTKHLYRSGVSSTDDHILWLASGVTPNLRHDSNTAR